MCPTRNNAPQDGERFRQEEVFYRLDCKWIKR
jgi:hypothetical protein